MIDLQEALLKKYVEVLNKPEYQDLLHAINNKDNKLSNIHLGFVPEHYESAEHKILIVGRETRSWYDSKKFDEYHAENVRQLMSLSKDFIWRNLTGDLKRNTRGATFSISSAGLPSEVGTKASYGLIFLRWTIKLNILSIRIGSKI